jgi:transcriptional regulator with XRE-family HTH domain
VGAIKQKRYHRGVPDSFALNALSSNLRHFRLARGLTQEQLAEKAGVTYRHYQQIEGVDRPGLRIVTAERLAKALEVDLASLFQKHPGVPVMIGIRTDKAMHRALIAQELGKVAKKKPRSKRV